MINSEQWLRWEPIPGLSRKYFVESISDNMKGFTIILCDASDIKKKLRIYFEDCVDCYRSANESFMSSIPYELHEKYGQEFYGDWTFFKVTNSEYLQWVSKKSYGWSEYHRSLTHFSILSTEHIIDILDTSEPIVEFINEE